MSDDVVTWLCGVLDEDEAAAKRALDAPPNGSFDPQWLWAVLYRRTIEHPHHSSSVARGAPTPSAVLADIAAKRTILDRAQDASRLAGSKPGYDTVARLNVSLAKVLAPELERVARLLACAYRDRPGYQETWRPA